MATAGAAGRSGAYQVYLLSNHSSCEIVEIYFTGNVGRPSNSIEFQGQSWAQYDFRRHFVPQTAVTWAKRGAKPTGCLRNLTREAGSERWSILSVEEAFPTDFIALCLTYV